MLKTILAVLFASGAVLAQQPSGAPLQGPMAWSDYPLSLADRPLVLPNLMPEFTPSYQFFKPVPGQNESATVLRLGVGLGDRAQFDLASAMLLDPNQEWSKILAPRLGFLAYDSPELDFAPSVVVPFDFHDNADLVSAVQVGAETRYRLDRTLYAFGMRDLLQFVNQPLPTGKQLQGEVVGNFGVGVVPMRNLSLELQAEIFRLKLTGDQVANKIIFGDEIPLAGRALIAFTRRFDVFGQLEMPDLKNGADSMRVIAGLNVRM